MRYLDFIIFRNSSYLKGKDAGEYFGKEILTIFLRILKLR